MNNIYRYSVNLRPIFENFLEQLAQFTHKRKLDVDWKDYDSQSVFIPAFINLVEASCAIDINLMVSKKNAALAALLHEFRYEIVNKDVSVFTHTINWVINNTITSISSYISSCAKVEHLMAQSSELKLISSFLPNQPMIVHVTYVDDRPMFNTTNVGGLHV